MPTRKFPILNAPAARAAALSAAARSDEDGALAGFSALKPDVAVELA